MVKLLGALGCIHVLFFSKNYLLIPSIAGHVYSPPSYIACLLIYIILCHATFYTWSLPTKLLLAHCCLFVLVLSSIYTLIPSILIYSATVVTVHFFGTRNIMSYSQRSLHVMTIFLLFFLCCNRDYLCILF